MVTTGRPQSKTLLTIDERGSKIDINSFSIADKWQLKTVSNDVWYTFVDSINIFDCGLPGVMVY